MVSVLLHPFMPGSAERLLAALGREDLSLDGARLGAVGGGAIDRASSGSSSPGWSRRSARRPDGPPVVDTHCHLDHCDPPDGELIERARAAGLSRLATVGIDSGSIERALQAAQDHDEVFAIVGRHPHETDRLRERRPRGDRAGGGRSERASDRRDRPRLLPRSRAAGRPAPRVRGAAGARRAAGAAGRDPHSRRRGRHLRHPARARRPAAGGDPALLLRPRPPRRVRRARLPLLLRGERDLPEGNRPAARGRRGPGRAAARRRPTRPGSRRSRCGGSRTSRATWCTPAQRLAELRGVSYAELDRTVEQNAARVFGW